MGILIDEFHRKRLLPRNRKNTNEWRRQNLRYVERWLGYAETAYRLQEIRQLRQKHYDAFVSSLADSGLSPETIRKYALAAKKFVRTSRLPIRINPESAKKRKVNTRLQRVRKILMDYGIEGDRLERMSQDLNWL